MARLRRLAMTVPHHPGGEWMPEKVTKNMGMMWRRGTLS
jgi:hypothetical protein